MFVIGVTKYSIGGAPLFYPIPFSHKKVYTAYGKNQKEEDNGREAS
jgi:hypothetical protein